MTSKKKRKTKRRSRKNQVFVLVLLILFSVGIAFGIRAMVQAYQKQSYPLTHKDLVMEAANTYAIPPETVFAVIKAESSFREDAVSAAGAVGLMQILPTTAEWISGRRKSAFDPEKLFDPVVNIDYGCYYLSYLFDRFGDWDAAHAAYNAGPATVERWMQDDTVWKNGSFLRIPYKETSDYLDRIHQYKEQYLTLYAKKGW